jgi:hypothetical protein
MIRVFNSFNIIIQFVKPKPALPVPALCNDYHHTEVMPLKCYNYPDMKEQINLGRWSEEEFESLIKMASRLFFAAEKIDLLSRQFLNVPYKESTLVGSKDEPEVFVVDLEAVDCFTFIDYVEAMRLSGSFKDFTVSLRKLRYQSGTVKFENRNHFFINWRENNSDFIDDVTTSIGDTVRADKVLNNKGDGTFYLPGVSCIKSTLNYVPSGCVDDKAVDKLKTGDYIGIYSDMPGLDVSHVGILIKGGQGSFLRHASQKYHKVVDEGFTEYIQDKPGIVVLRPAG